MLSFGFDAVQIGIGDLGSVRLSLWQGWEGKWSDMCTGLQTASDWDETCLFVCIPVLKFQTGGS